MAWAKAQLVKTLRYKLEDRGFDVVIVLNSPAAILSLVSTEFLIDMSKAIPLQAWTGPEGSRRLRLPDFKTIST